jgi:hypothetical protein
VVAPARGLWGGITCLLPSGSWLRVSLALGYSPPTLLPEAPLKPRGSGVRLGLGVAKCEYTMRPSIRCSHQKKL